MYEILDKNKAALIIWIDIHLHVFCIGKWRTYVMGISCVFSSVQSLSRVWLFATPWTTAHQASHVCRLWNCKRNDLH